MHRIKGFQLKEEILKEIFRYQGDKIQKKAGKILKIK